LSEEPRQNVLEMQLLGRDANRTPFEKEIRVSLSVTDTSVSSQLTMISSVIRTTIPLVVHCK